MTSERVAIGAPDRMIPKELVEGDVENPEISRRTRLFRLPGGMRVKGAGEEPEAAFITVI